MRGFAITGGAARGGACVLAAMVMLAAAACSNRPFQDFTCTPTVAGGAARSLNVIFWHYGRDVEGR